MESLLVSSQDNASPATDPTARVRILETTDLHMQLLGGGRRRPAGGTGILQRYAPLPTTGGLAVGCVGGITHRNMKSLAHFLLSFLATPKNTLACAIIVWLIHTAKHAYCPKSRTGNDVITSPHSNTLRILFMRWIDNMSRHMYTKFQCIRSGRY